MSDFSEMRSDFQRVMAELRFEDYKQDVSNYTVERYGFHADQAYPKTTDRVALACYECEDEPSIAGDLIAKHHNVPELLPTDG